MKKALRRLSLAVVFTAAVALQGQAAPLHRSSKPQPLSAAELRVARAEYQHWLPQFRERALRAGIRPDVFDSVMSRVRVNPVVLKNDRWQPERTRTFMQYEAASLSPHFLREGVDIMRQPDPDLDRIAAKSGVPKQYLISLWGFESDFGKNQGDFYIPEALATLASAGRPGIDGRRKEQFTDWLLTTLRLVQKGAIRPDDALGSWAACEGMFQFSPDDYVAHAVDDDGDGRKDIWGNRRDAFASAAAKLRDDGWRAGQGWGGRVALPRGFDLALTGYSSKNHDRHRTIAEWRRLGVVLEDGSPLPGDDAERVEIIAPGSDKASYAGGPVFLARRNFDVLMHWNQSSYFVASVCEGADRIVADAMPERPAP